MYWDSCNIFLIIITNHSRGALESNNTIFTTSHDKFIANYDSHCTLRQLLQIAEHIVISQSRNNRQLFRHSAKTERNINGSSPRHTDLFFVMKNISFISLREFPTNICRNMKS